MTAAKAPKPQRKLGTSGTRIWTDITREYDLDVAELIVLETAAHQADDIARLEALLESEGEIQVGSNGQPKLSSVFGGAPPRKQAGARQDARPVEAPRHIDGRCLEPRQQTSAEGGSGSLAATAGARSAGTRRLVVATLRRKAAKQAAEELPASAELRRLVRDG